MPYLREKYSKKIFFFYGLVAYVFLQFVWWTYLLFELNNEVYKQKTELIIYKAEDEKQIIKEGNDLHLSLHKKWTMIVGEGTVFIVIITLGIFQIKRTHQKELELILQQKNFLLSVTHELKTPIASAKLQLQTVRKRQLDVQKEKRLLDDAIVDLDRLNNLVDNILLSAQIDSGTSVFSKEKLDISQLVNLSLSKIMPLIKQKIKTEIEDGIYLSADEMSFSSIVLNLVENASKYSPEESTISVSLTNEDSSVKLRVCDKGPGISLENKENIFKKFYRLENEETRKTKGTGLGLYIVKKLVESNNGTIVVNDNLPQGSIFEVTFNNQ